MSADHQKRGPARRGMYILPSLFTAGSIAAGFYAIVQSLQGSPTEPHHFDHAALVIGLAIPFDGLDGRIARMTNTASDFGKELDSLADVITFGVAPSILAYSWGFRMLPPTMDPVLRHKLLQIGAVVCFLFLICGACRLARFNTSADAKPKNPGRPDRKYFVGMPIPAAAGVIAACVHCFLGTPVFSASGCRCVDWLDWAGWISDGEHLAVLERERDYADQPPSVSGAGADWRGGFGAAVVLPGFAAGDCVGLYVFRAGSAGGVYLDIATSTNSET